MDTSQCYAGNPNSSIIGVSGGGFVSGCEIYWNGTEIGTTFSSAAYIQGYVTSSLAANAGPVTITVASPAPGGGTSNAVTITILQGYWPTVTSSSPAMVTAGSPDLTMTVTGTGFLTTAYVQYSGFPLATTFLSPTQLTAVVPAADIAAGGTLSLYVINPNPSPVVTFASSSITLTIFNPVPALNSILPVSLTAGSAPATLTISGSGFAPAASYPRYGLGSTVTWNGNSLSTQYISPTQLAATVPASFIAAPGNATVTVVNAAPGGGTTGGLAVSVVPPTTLQTTYSNGGRLGTNGWYQSPACPVTLYAVGPIGVADTYDVLDGGTQQVYTAAVSVAGEGYHTLQFWSVDTQGAIEPTNTISIKIDSQAPAVTLGTITPAPNAAGWNNTPVTIPFTASDATSGLAFTSPTASPIVLSSEGKSQYRFASATDNAGNMASAYLQTGLNIDFTPPVTTSAITGTQGAGGIYISPVAITFSATDNLSGIATTSYTIDGGGPQTYGGSINLANGSHTLTYWSTDVAGNQETAHSLIVTIYRNPTANNDALMLSEYTTATVPAPGVLANDTDPNGLPLTAALVAQPAHGTVTLSANGGYVYTQTAPSVGPDSFTYQASNGTFSSNPATVAITVQAPGKPTITGFTPASGPVGTDVVITGTNLGGASKIRFHNASAVTFSVNGAGTQITVTVPAGAATGTITVTTPAGSVTSSGTFTVVPAHPTITSFTPTSGRIGTIVTITGTNLGGVSKVRFHNASAVTFSVNGAGTQITVTVPAGAATGTITVTTPAGSVTSSGTFTVTS